MILSACLALLLSVQARIDPQIEKLFAWMDKLDCSQYLDRQFVKVSYVDDSEREAAFGFLVSDNPQEFSILLPNLAITKFSKKPWRRYEGAYMFAPIDFRLMVRNTIARTDADRYILEDGSKPLPGRGFSLAYICQRKGMTSEANLLIAKAINNLRDEEAKDIFESGKAQVYSDVLHVAVAAFEDPHVSKSDLFIMFSTLATKFEDWPHDNEFAIVAKSLEATAKTDSSHISKPFQSMTTDEQVAELVWQIHQEGTYWMQEDSPIDKLRDIGMPAVPQLLKACEDTSFVRALYHPMTGPMRPYSSSSIRTVQTEVLGVIEGMAHQRFGYGDTTDGIRLAKDWYAEIQAKGERETLIKGIKAGTIDSSDQARRLISLDPKGALPIVIEGYDAPTMSSWTRSHMLEVLKNLPSPETAAFLRKVLSGTDEIPLRVAAAKSLSYSDPDATSDALIKTWTDNARKRPDGFEFGDVIEGLLMSQKPSVIALMQKEFRKNSVKVRGMVIDKLLSRRDRYEWKSPQKPDAKVVERFQQMSEDLLASELDDNEETGGGYGFNGFMLINAKLSDLALVNLHYYRPETFPFAPSHEQRMMDIQKAKALNIYRSRKGLSPLPLPIFVDPRPIPLYRLAPLFNRVEMTNDAIAVREVVAKSFAAYPTLLNRIDSTAPGVGQERLIEVARVISCQIREVNVVGANTEIEKAIATRMSRLRGQSVTSELINQIAKEFGPNNSARAGANLKLRRDGETPGFTLTLLFSPTIVGDWIDASVDENSTYNLTGGKGSFYAYLIQPEIALALHRFLASAPNRRLQFNCDFDVADKKKAGP